MNQNQKTAAEIAEEARLELNRQSALEHSANGEDPVHPPQSESPADQDTPEYTPTTPEGTRPEQVLEEEGLARKNK